MLKNETIGFLQTYYYEPGLDTSRIWFYFIEPSATHILKISSIVDKYKTDVGFSASITRFFSVQVEFIILFISSFLKEYGLPTVKLLTCPCAWTTCIVIKNAIEITIGNIIDLWVVGCLFMFQSVL